MKTTLSLSLIFSAQLLLLANTQAAIATAGDVMLTGFNADGTDDLAFVLLSSYDANTTIYFTDNEWDGSAFNTGENYWSWNAAVNLDAGTIVNLSTLSSIASVAASVGTVAFNGSPSNPGLSASGESIYVYMGSSYDTAAPTFLTALATGGFINASPTGLLTNTGLTAGSTAVVFTGGEDIAAYTASRTDQLSFTDYQSKLANPSNWTSQNASGDQDQDGIGPDVPFSSAPFTTVPEPSQTLLLGLIGVFAACRRQTR